ncbi:MAG: hypothetical protein IPP81_04585 [Chitinophagaceae bacterium]|nr:hypothetical protein [Chitinophagaceae bacterium]
MPFLTVNANPNIAVNPENASWWRGGAAGIDHSPVPTAIACKIHLYRVTPCFQSQERSGNPALMQQAQRVSPTRLTVAGISAANATITEIPRDHPHQPSTPVGDADVNRRAPNPAVLNLVGV